MVSMEKDISYKAPAIFADYFVMYLNLQSCAISGLLLHEQGREIKPNSHLGAAKSLCPRMILRVRAVSLCCPLVLLYFKENFHSGGSGEASPAQPPGNVLWDR